MTTPRTVERNNRAAGFICLLGAGVAALGSLLPWATFHGPSGSLNIYEVFSVDAHLDSSIGGSNDAAPVLIAVGVAAVLALIVIGAHRSRAPFSRLLAFLIGCGVAAFGGYLIWWAQNYYDQLASDQSGGFLNHVARLIEGGALQTFTSLDPGPGAYLMAVGGAMIALGALVPGQRIYLPYMSGEMTHPSSEASRLRSARAWVFVRPVKGDWLFWVCAAFGASVAVMYWLQSAWAGGVVAAAAVFFTLAVVIGSVRALIQGFKEPLPAMDATPPEVAAPASNERLRNHI